MSIPQQFVDHPPAQEDRAEDTPTRSFERVPPQDLDAEQSALGGMLLNKDAISHVVEVLGTPRDHVWYRPAHELIYKAIFDLWSGDEPADVITVAAELTKRGEIERVGHASYLHTLAQAVHAVGNADHYAEIVLERAKRRRAVEIGTALVHRGYSNDGDTDALIHGTLAELQDLTATTLKIPELTVADRWQGWMERKEKGKDPRAIDTPWKDLNDVANIKPGDMVTVGAGTGVGKSMVAVQWGSHVAMKLGKPVLYFSLEMTADSLIDRIVACIAKVNLGRLSRMELTDDDWEKIARVNDQMSQAHGFALDDTGSVTLSHIRARVRWMASRGTPVGAIFVDYLQLMEDETKSSGGNRAQEVARISRGLKTIGMDFQIPVIALAQFNREAKDRRPQITDFKESSSIEQDSAMILLLHAEKNEQGEVINPDEITMIVAKNRQGEASREIELIKRGHLSRLDSKILI